MASQYTPRQPHPIMARAEALAGAGRTEEAMLLIRQLAAFGVAVREHPEALAILAPALDHIVKVTDAEVAEAMRAIFADTHNVAEGAGAAALAAALQEKDRLAGLNVGITLCGGNVDSATFARVPSGAQG